MTSPPAGQPPTPRPAASIVMLRDGGQGIEVFMVERHQGAGLAFSGALVFPGGKVDAEDRATAWPELAPPDGGPDLAFWVAAVRETFEEAGILLARQQGSGAFVAGVEVARLAAQIRRGGPNVAGAPFAPLLRHEGLVPALDALVHFGHWITPTWAPRRFDTHFFLVRAPADQCTQPDLQESAAGLWLSPVEAIEQTDRGHRSLVAVTRFTLELLATWSSVEEALAAARRRQVVTVLPQRERTSEGFVLRIPKAAGYVRSELLVPRG